VEERETLRMTGKRTGWRNKGRRIWRFLSEDVWDIELSSLSRMRRTGVKTIRVIFLVIKGFREDQCPLHASALTYNTLLSLVPVLAVLLALAQGFDVGDKFVAQATDTVGTWTDTMREAAATTNASVDAIGGTNEAVTAMGTNTVPWATQNTGGDTELADSIDAIAAWLFEVSGNINFTAMGGVGLAILLWTVVRVLGRVEASFNQVWGVTSGRPLYRKFFDYLGVLIVVTLLALAAMSLPVADLACKVLGESSSETVKGILGSRLLGRLTVLAMTTLTFTFLIMFMPNTRVRTGPGIIGGFVAALLFIGWLWLCALLQIGAARTLKIYASVAVVPILLVWVCVSWQIILFGAEVAFAVQNCTTYRMETRAHSANMQSRMILAISVVSQAAKSMLGSEPGIELSGFAREKRVPIRLLNEVVDQLVHGKLLAELAERPGNYVLLRSPGKLQVKEVLDVMLRSGARPEELGLNLVSPAVQEALARADAGTAQGLDELCIRDLSVQP
jgi:membrane protein